MATEDFVYLTVQEAVKFHVLYMRKLGETRFGVFDRNSIESALARPKHSATTKTPTSSPNPRRFFTA
ncbi:MAG: hypothetical protein M3Q33_06605 [Acidobacteriota bacterium]|nr:hypothetical protein [Acidobacteriota bacterium]